MNERYQGKAARVAAFLTFFILLVSSAFASVNVSPLRVYLSERDNKEVIRFTNESESTKSYEVEVVSWTQTEEQREVYGPTEDVVVVPPLFTLEPGEEQLIRVGLLGTPDPVVEKAYRVFITELAPSEDEEPESAGIAMRLRIGVPVFVTPEVVPSASLAYVDAIQVGDHDFVRFRNTGTKHVKVTEVRYSRPGSAEATATPAVVYIHAGQTAYLPVDAPNGATSGTITVVTEGLGDLEYEWASSD